MPDLTIAPELISPLQQHIEQLKDAPKLCGANLGYYRKRSRRSQVKPLADVEYTVITVPSSETYREFRLWVINGKLDGKMKPALLHFHGGGFVMGNCESSLLRLQGLAKNTHTVIVSVEYGLAPEVKVAESINQNIAALNWLIKNAKELGVDHAKIGVIGMSAGGGHAALLAQHNKRLGIIDLACQILIYPMLDNETGSTHKPPSPRGQYVWTAEHNQFGWTAFLGKKPESKKILAEWVPAKAADLSGLPPTFIGVGDLDLFYEENKYCAERLQLAGIKTEFHEINGAFHAFDTIGAGTPIASAFEQKITDSILHLWPSA